MKVIFPYLALAPRLTLWQEFVNSSSCLEEVIVITVAENKEAFLSLDLRLSVVVVEVLADTSYHEAIRKALLSLADSTQDLEEIAILPPAFVIDDKTLVYAKNLLHKDCTLVFMDQDDNVVHRIEDKNKVELSDYTLYPAYDKEPQREDYATFLLGFYKSLSMLFNLEECQRLQAHYLYKYYYLRLYAQKKYTAHIVNNRFFFDAGETLCCNRVYAQDLEYARALPQFFKKPPEFRGLRRLLGCAYADSHFYLCLFSKILRVRIKREPRFPKNAMVYRKVNPVKSFPVKRAAIVAGFTKNGEISKSTFNYLCKIRENCDYVVFVADSLATPSCIEILANLTDALIIERHREYDFGSYKRGFMLLQDNGILGKVDSLLLCNDSIDFVGESTALDEIFVKAKDYDAYGLCYATYGFGERLKRHHYAWVKMPHLQSYFVILQKKAFLAPAFGDFMQKIKRLKNKREIIKQYEMGFSSMLKSLGLSLGSYYPFDEHNVVNPYVIYLSGHLDRPLFTKHMLSHTAYVSE